MKSHRILLVAALACAVLLPFAGNAHAKPAQTMHRYLLISPHTQEECLAALDGVAAQGGAKLAKWEFGCDAGDHTGYTIVTAASEEQARAMIPENVRDKAQVKALNKYTVAQIKSFHEMHDQQQTAPAGSEGK